MVSTCLFRISQPDWHNYKLKLIQLTIWQYHNIALATAVYIQWNLQITDTLGVGPLSFVERLSLSRSVSLNCSLVPRPSSDLSMLHAEREERAWEIKSRMKRHRRIINIERGRWNVAATTCRPQGPWFSVPRRRVMATELASLLFGCL